MPRKKGQKMKAKNESENTCEDEKSTDLYMSMKFITFRYISWENNANLCWLNSVMALLVHNRTLRAVLRNKINVQANCTSQIEIIIKAYDDAMHIVNDLQKKDRLYLKLQNASAKLLAVQVSSLRFLQPLMKLKLGEPDSAFCCLLNFLNENVQIKQVFDINFSWLKDCKTCKQTQLWKTFTKPIITLSKVNDFLPSAPESVYQCVSCCTQQIMKVKYRTLPPCLIFHFESGAGQGNLHSLNFTMNDRRYQMTGVVVLQKSSKMSHFVTWIRNPSTDSWLECNDLSSRIVTFSNKQPRIELKNVCIVVYEAFDKLGTQQVSLSDSELIATDDLKTVSVPCIDISDDTSENNQNPNSKDIKSSSSVGTFKSIKPQQNNCSALDVLLVESDSRQKRCASDGYVNQIKRVKQLKTSEVPSVYHKETESKSVISRDINSLTKENNENVLLDSNQNNFYEPFKFCTQASCHCSKMTPFGTCNSWEQMTVFAICGFCNMQDIF